MGEFKDYRERKNKVLDYDSSFSQHRKVKWFYMPHGSFGEQGHLKSINEDHKFNEKFHLDPDIKPLNLTEEHKKAIVNYTSASSEKENGHGSSNNMNSYLLNRSGIKSREIMGNHDPETVLDSVNKLSSTFTPENTNKKNIETFGAVPAHVGREMEKSDKGDIHIFPAFTSTTSSFGNAVSFAWDYHEKAKETPRVDHIINYKLPIGTGVSVVSHSPWPENEVLINHGTHMKYSHTETISRKYDGVTTKVHHIDVLNKREPISSYGQYYKED
jgi:hypothetical protein